jgi:hypothetical protein
MKVHIISIFDKNHMARALACRSSLAVHAPDSPVYWLCLDDTSYAAAKKLNLPNTSALRPEDLNDAELLAIRSTRTNPEFASTCKPAFLRYMMKSGIVSTDDLLIFMDPDFYFYESAKPLFEKIYKSGSITVTPHRYPPHRTEDQYKKGAYNAGIVFFKNDAEALSCLEEWRKQCIKWCYLRYENGQIGDQGYMNEWPKTYPHLHELADKGVNLSTWNIENYTITSPQPNQFLIDGEPLICYHFHGLKIYFDEAGMLHAFPITVFHSHIYKPGLAALRVAYNDLQKIDPQWTYGTVPRPHFLRILKQKIMRMVS